eukprot:g6485.t1
MEELHAWFSSCSAFVLKSDMLTRISSVHGMDVEVLLECCFSAARRRSSANGSPSGKPKDVLADQILSSGKADFAGANDAGCGRAPLWLFPQIGQGFGMGLAPLRQESFRYSPLTGQEATFTVNVAAVRCWQTRTQLRRKMSSPVSLPIPGRTDDSLDSHQLREQEKKETRKKFFDRHCQLKERLDQELQCEMRAEEVLKAKGRQVEDSMEHPADWQRARDEQIEAAKERKRAYLRMWSIKEGSLRMSCSRC